MHPDSRDFTRILWSLAAGTALAAAITLVAERSDSAVRLDPRPAYRGGTPVYVEVDAPGMEPEVFKLGAGATVAQALRAAGIAVPRGVFDHAALRSGESLVVDGSGVVRRAHMSGAKLVALGLKIPLQSARVEDLEAIPGIGEVLARRIVDFRTRRGGITGWKELLQVRGVGPRTLERLQAYASLGKRRLDLRDGPSP